MSNNRKPVKPAGPEGIEALKVGQTASVIPAGEGALSKIERAVRELQEIKRLNDAMQQQYAPDSAAWHQCETIDDRVHDALSALGE